MTKTYTLEQLTKYVSDTFITEYVEENKFDNFREMKECYMYDTNDIKEEIECMLKETNWNLLDDGSEVTNEYEFITYRKFMNMVYAEMKKVNKY